jgi:peptidoglycan hydrolase CwlO-like protein
MKKYILPILILLLLCWIVFDKVKDFGLSTEFTTKQDSLVHAVDSLKLEIAKDDAEIDSLDIVAVELQYKLDHQKAKVKTIVEYIEVEKNNIDGFSNPELVSSFNNRYPADTITNPLLVAQPVLVSAAKDLVELDGAKQIIVLKDSSITTLESKVTVKDSIIGKYVNKELNYKNIILNKDKEITGWEGQYQKLELQYNKLKVKSKFQRIGSYVVIGGLAYLMLVK